MRYIAMTKPGDPSVLQMGETEAPQPEAGQILIKVARAGVNRPDVFQRLGFYPPPPGASPILGLEVAGEVAALGRDVRGFRQGDQVCALTNGGGYAEQVCVDAGQCLPVPAGLSPDEAAALPETAFTVWSNVFDRGRLQPDETLLVHGGGSGIGTTAIQMAVATGARVLATAGTAEKCRVCEELGATAFNYQETDFAEAVMAATGGRGADVILDMVGGDYINKNLQVAAVDGRIISIAFLRGSRAEVDLMPMMRKRLTLSGSTLRPQTAEEKARIAANLLKDFWPLIEAGKIRPRIGARFPASEAAKAHALMESNQLIGKVVLDMSRT